MWALFYPLKTFLKFRKQNDDHHFLIDNWIFRLHYNVTSVLFFLATSLVTARQFFGDHIQCLVDIDKEFVKVVETYCFATYTFSLAKYHEISLRLNGMHPGIGPYAVGSDETLVKHGYYQWIPFVLFAQAIMFRVTYWMWKNWEGGVISKLSQHISLAELKDVGKFPLMDCIKSRSTWGYMLVLLELLNFLNVILQIYITDKFLNGMFLSYVPRLQMYGWETANRIFPKTTKCIFHKYGHSGSIETHDALCILALNIIHEKIYAIIWIWLAILFVLSSLGIVWRVFTMIMFKKSRLFNRLALGNFKREKMHFYELGNVINVIGYSEWLFLKYLSKNMDAPKFEELIVSALGEGSEQIEFPLEEGKKQYHDMYFGN